MKITRLVGNCFFYFINFPLLQSGLITAKVKNLVFKKIKMDSENVELIERPGYLGRKKQERHEEWDKEFGKNNWTFVWKFGERQLSFEEACLVYEDAYLRDSSDRKREKIWKDLFANARDVYDNSETNVNSSLDYTIQEAYSTHLQDIAIRRVGIRRGWKFKGEKLIQVRGPGSEGYLLMPGIVRFHSPKMIEMPDGVNLAPSWAHPKSVESFYQNNRWLARKKHLTYI